MAALKNIDTGYLEKRETRRGGPKGLSGLFLPSVRDTYASARHKVMIIGSETAGWEPLATRSGEQVVYREFESVESYVDTSMRKHRHFFDKKLAQEKSDRGHTFHNYTRALAQLSGSDGLVYANLFCFDWRKSSPIRSPEFGFVKALSRQLLDAQIDVLRPDFIVFANGITSARYRREFFPHGEGGRCSHERTHPDVVPAHYLWEFVLDGRIRCFRVHHPSARHDTARAGRAGALALLAAAL